MTLNFAIMTLALMLAAFVGIIGGLIQYKPVARGGLIACVAIILLGVAFSTIGKETIEITNSGVMQPVDGQYIYRSGKSNDHLHFFILGDGEEKDKIVDVYAETYEIRVSNDRPYTYDEATYYSQILFLKYKSKKYIVYVPTATVDGR